jgi:hypothetical protein
VKCWREIKTIGEGDIGSNKGEPKAQSFTSNGEGLGLKSGAIYQRQLKPIENAIWQVKEDMVGFIRSVEDEPIWEISKKGLYSAAETGESLRTKGEEAKWWSIVWFSRAIPRHNFILWLACRNALFTGERLFFKGYKGDTVSFLQGVS